MNSRAVTEGAQRQGEDEIIVYTLNVAANGSTPTGVAVVVKDKRDDYADVTATVMPSGSAMVAGNVISLPPLRALTAGRIYRVEVKYTLDNGNTLEDFFEIVAER